ncbi:hypothetical protein EYF80_025731 [Liparis tanakae]|uniref:Uncharacterized protein n=1 Tax=Liparis tanakae TaxID=230148 RepID=A0A4Z2HDP5_9TELE|nr:hypothetical protein EYF80_025731 [Liparis tanakae]
MLKKSARFEQRSTHGEIHKLRLQHHSSTTNSLTLTTNHFPGLNILNVSQYITECPDDKIVTLEYPCVRAGGKNSTCFRFSLV